MRYCDCHWDEAAFAECEQGNCRWDRAQQRRIDMAESAAEAREENRRDDERERRRDEALERGEKP